MATKPEAKQDQAQAQAAKKNVKAKKKSLKGVTSGIATIQASFNNTIVTITDKQGNTISWAPRVWWDFTVPRNPPRLPPR